MGDDQHRSDPLQDYRKKRDFQLTREPSGEHIPRAKQVALPFVIQKHAARALHYDFRLALDGTLKSWAVPKGPSLDPHDKRMAVQVEDHPLAYAGFEGTIPAGQYGAGSVIVWDRGSWTPVGDARAGLREGKLKFQLHGEKLSGGWTLVRLRGRADETKAPWLLIKERDDAARPAAEFDVVSEQPDSVLSGDAVGAGPAPAAKAATKKITRAAKATATATELPLSLAPQLATLASAAPTSGDWRWEMKFDGYRLLARRDGDDLRLFTRSGHDWTAKLPHLKRALLKLDLASGWLDGEIVQAAVEHGAPSFQALQDAFESRKLGEVVYYLFDAPFLNGEDLRALPLLQRRERLRTLLAGLPGDGPLRFSEDFDAAPGELLHTACQLRMEGLIGKRADAPYVSRRSADWLKLKCTQRQEFVIVGYTDPQGNRSGFGALLLAVHDREGRLQYAGNVGSGFNTATLKKLAVQLQALESTRSPLLLSAAELKEAGIKAGVHWVRPKLVAEVSFSEWTGQGRVRHSVFHALRSDKPAGAIVHEQPVAVKGGKLAAAAPENASELPPPASGRACGKLPAGLKLTHASRVIDAKSGTTKQQLAEFYAAVAPRLLKLCEDRPLALVRGPEGVGGQLFFQKHAAGLKIPGLTQLDPSLDPGHAPLVTMASARTLLGAVQMNVIELHAWNGRVRSVEGQASIAQPDRLTFDLDPGEGVAWPQVQEAAQLVHAMLDELKLTAFLKTSGGKGLHVVVPFQPDLGWDAVKAFSKAIVQHLASTLPQRFVAKSGPKNRVGKIFVDYLRNGFGATTACAWSARARPGLGVSVPVDWEELPTLTGGDHWTVPTIAARLKAPDRWAGMARHARQKLQPAMQVLGHLP